MAIAELEVRALARPVARRTSPIDVALVGLALGFAALGLRPLRDPDVWWHLRTGELILESGFTKTDPWSHASSNPWLLHEWASQVLMYVSYLAGGYRGVIVLHSLLMLTLAIVLIGSIRAVSTPAISFFIGLLALVGVFLGSAERPQLISWILLAAVLPALRRWTAARRPPWWLIPVVAIWANLHGLWAMSLALYGCLTIGLAVDVGFARWRAYRSFVLIGFLSLAAASLTPNGPALLMAPLHVREYARFVAEWNPPTLLNPFFGASFILLAIVVVGWARGGRKVDAVEITFVLGGCLASLPYIRTMPVLAIALAPVAAATLNRLARRPTVEYRQNHANVALSAALVITFVSLAVLWLPQIPSIARGAPWKASAELDALPGRARVLNEYVLGGWLLWSARDTSPAIDGRTEIYAPDYLAETLRSIDSAPGWKSYIEREQLSAVWISKDAPLVRGLKEAGWRVHFRDEDSVIMLPPQT